MLDRTDILGVGFDNVSLNESVRRAMSMIMDGERHYAVTPNSEIVYLCLRDERARGAINGADIVLPDGSGVVLASRMLKTPLGQKVAGIDFASALCEMLAAEKKSLFLFGAKPGVAEAAADALKERFEGLNVCGTADGYFSDEQAVVSRINDAKPDVLFVCLGAPKQELWMAKWRDRLDTSLSVGLGGSLDVFAGNVKRAPGFMIRLNLEWLYRLACDPRRIGRMMSLPRFLLRAFFEGQRR